MMQLPVKRSREKEQLSLANYFVLLSRGAGSDSNGADRAEKNVISNDAVTDSPNRVFECKTCSKKFSSFQALGGHRASHKKPRLLLAPDPNLFITMDGSPETKFAKTHECSICGLEFAIGQALGGHMRRHRVTAANNDVVAANVVEDVASRSTTLPFLSLSPPPRLQVPIVKKYSNSRRVRCLDLNLAPPEIDLEFKLEKLSPTRFYKF